MNTIIGRKIPALRGRKAENNKTILELVALNGVLNRYQLSNKSKQPIHKQKPAYKVVLDRTKDLTNAGYLAIVEEKPQKKRSKEKTPGYGLTWKGFIASLSIDKVVINVISVLRNSPLLRLPMKETWLDLLEQNEVFSSEEVEAIARGIFRGLIEVLPHNIELIDDQNLLFYLPLTKRFVDTDKIDKQKVSERITLLLRHPTVLNLLEKLKTFQEGQIEQNKRTLEETKQIIRRIKSNDPHSWI